MMPSWTCRIHSCSSAARGSLCTPSRQREARARCQQKETSASCAPADEWSEDNTTQARSACRNLTEREHLESANRDTGWGPAAESEAGREHTKLYRGRQVQRIQGHRSKTGVIACAPNGTPTPLA